MWIDNIDDNRDLMSKNVASKDPAKHVDLSPDEMEMIRKTTGYLICRNSVVTADLEEPDVVVVPMHTFKKWDGLSHCTFRSFAGVSVDVNLEDAKYFILTWLENPKDYYTDMIALRLSWPVKGIDSTKMISYPSWPYEFRRNQTLIIVSGGQDDWDAIHQMPWEKMTEPLVYMCQAKFLSVEKTGEVLETNCAADSGGSGAKAYVRKQDGTLLKVAMLVGIINQGEKGESFANGSPYAFDKFASAFLVLDTSKFIAH